jgi:hypothetical protein
MPRNDEMSDDYRTGQGTIIPTLFIGSGGTGSRIVDRIAARAQRLPNWESQLRPLTHFVSIDTNELDQHKLKAIPEGNRINIAAFDKAKAIDNFRRSKDRQALQWLDRAYQPRPGFKPGAGQIRVESRLGFFYYSAEIRQRLRQLVVASLRPGITWRQDSPPKYNVYLFCTLAGGTGSGSFLSIAYLIDDVIREQEWQPRVVGNLLLSSLMVDKVGPELHPDIHANTYAALKELEHLTKLDYAQVKREGRTYEDFVFCRDENRREVQRVRSRPFFVAFVFDRPPHLGLPDVQGAVADAAYLQVFTPIMDNLAGELDNYEKHLEELTRFPGDLKNVGLGYCKNFGAYGAAALVLPGYDLLEYSSLRFAAQAIRSQITFGVDPRDPGDDRARELARLAVRYDDPKFLNMSDEGRERAINDAFVHSVRAMARWDVRDELPDGYWLRLEESVDEGRVTGSDDKGEPVRGESLVDRAGRQLEEARRELLDKVAIKDRPFVFHKEGVGQYIELVSRLGEEIRLAHQIVDEDGRNLEAAAKEGEIVADLKLDPIHERYLVIRLLDKVANGWLPEAEQQLDQTRKSDFNNPKVRDRLETELYQSLQEAAGSRGLFKKDQAFYDVREQAQDEYRKVAKAARKTFDAEVRVRQLRGLLDYLRNRSRQYTRLATHMDALVRELEREAERLRRGETEVVPSLALRVEVFETLDEPRQRLWDEVYQRLYVRGGKYVSTFDRETLTATITAQLKPTVRADGKVVPKSVDEIVADLRRALLALGRERLRPAIFGSDGRPGLDLAAGLQLEAEIQLRSGKKAGQTVTEDEVEEYREKKFRALNQLAGVLARVSAAESKALDDGVKANRTRQLIINLGGDGGSPASAKFLERLKAVLSTGSKQVKEDHEWHDPRIAIVHDVELPIPLYYLEPVTREIEDAYLQLAADERRSYQLHTDYNWEKSLPNLNPRRSEITVGWALKVLAAGLVTQVISRRDGRWVWHVTQDQIHELGDSLSSALYRVGEIHRNEDLQKALDRALARGRERLGADTEEERRRRLGEQVEGMIADMGLHEIDGEMSREDALDRPVLRALLTVIHEGALRQTAAACGDRYAGLGFD